ncbi:MAG: prolipoprotein diacylglyceryl transferase [Nanoarchaeota archaeon]
MKMLDPIVFNLFGFSIRWYGIVYTLGFLFGYFFILHFSKYFKFDKNKIETIFLWTMIFSVLGGRLFYILFYNFDFYFSNPVKLLAVWEGGMSIHGGILGAFLSLSYFSKKYKINKYSLLDLFVLPASFMLAIGRFANFVNQELVGKITDKGFGVVFPKIDNFPRHPSVLYESLNDFLIFQVNLYLFFFQKLKAGTLTAIFLIWYNFGRFFIDFFRMPTIDLGVISMGQLLCLIFGSYGIWMLIKIQKHSKIKTH